MNSFVKTFLAALLAIVVANLVMGLFFFVVMAAFGTVLTASTETVGPGSVLRIDLSETIVDEPVTKPLADFDPFSMRVDKKLVLLDILNAIERASIDPRVEGIYFNPGLYTSPGIAALGEIRAELDRFRESSGKFVISYSNGYSQGTYYLASVSDKIFLNPEGDLLWKGMSARISFYKGLLDKLEIEPQVIRHGEFKSAVEPFILDKMSPENRLQYETLTGTVWGSLVAQISASRSVDSAQLQSFASRLAISDAASAVEAGMVDSLAYASGVEELLCEITGAEETPSFISLSSYIMDTRSARKYSKNKIALIYAEGNIVDGDGGTGLIGGDDIARKLNLARNDEKVKAVVLRINSGGGSALASEVIWNEMERLRAEKPVIVSMGDVAASGGYYIAAPADAILASPTTITGSIGVFGLMFNIGQGMRNKLGITSDVVKTNPAGDIGNPYRSLTSAEQEYLQKSVERVYGTFIGHVADGRNLTVDEVDRIGEGRVWSGVSALEIGLIDSYGGLKESIALAAERAGVADDFQVASPSAPMDRLSQIIELLSAKILSGRSAEDPFRGELGAVYREYARLQLILSQKGVQASMPYTVRFE